MATSRDVASRARLRSRHETQADNQAGEMAGLAALSQHGGDEQLPEPRLALKRLDGAPGLERDGRGERGWQAAGFAERLASLLQPRCRFCLPMSVTK